MDDEFEPVVGLQCPIDIYVDPHCGVTIRQDQTGMMGEPVRIFIATNEAVRDLAMALLRGIGEAE